MLNIMLFVRSHFLQASFQKCLANFIIAFFLVLLLFSGVFAASQESPTRFVLISDTHLGFRKSNEAFTAFLQDIANLPFPIQGIINNGDITETGDPAMFQLYRNAMQSLKIPYWSVIGNHDTRWNPNGKDTYREQIGPLYFSKDFAGIHWMFLDSTLEHQTQGHIDAREIKWIQQDLSHAPANKPILVFSHHPLKWNGISIDNGLDILNLFSGHPVAAFFNGHGHRLERITFHNIPFLENDALFHGVYLILEKQGNEIRLFEKEIGNPEMTPWFTFSLHPEPFPQDEVDIFVPGTLKRFPLGEIYAGLSTNGKLIFAGTLSGSLAAVDTQGKIKWKKQLAGDVLASPELWQGILYVGTRAGILYALQADTGKFLWQWKGTFPVTSPPLISHGVVYLIAGDKNLYAFAAKTGEILWKTLLDGFTEAKPAAARDKIFIGTWNRTFYAIQTKDGKILWQKTIGKSIYYAPSVVSPVPAGNLVLIPAKDHFLHAFQQDTGKEEWSAPLNDGFTNPIFVKKELLVPETNGNIAALSPDTGEIPWNRKFPTSFYNASPILTENDLILPGVDGKLLFYNLLSQKVEENFTLSHGFLFSTPVAAGGYLWVGSLDGYLYKIPLPAPLPAQ